MLQDESTKPEAAGRWGRRFSISGALFLFVLVIAGPIVHHHGEQQGSRYALTAAIWDRHTVVLDDYNHVLGRDRAVIDGTIYSDKAPGQPFLMVPFYAVYRLVGGEPADVLRWDENLGLWWLTLWSAAIPGAILALLIYRWSREVEPETALLATLGMSLGTLLLVYSTLLFGHVLAALFAFGMFLLVRQPTPSLSSLMAAGALGGAAVLVEYPVALVIAVLVIAAFVKHGRRAIGAIAGGIPPALLLGIYNMRLFGKPFAFTYQWSAFGGPREDAREVVDIFAGPSLERLLHILFSGRGLFVASPVVVIAVLGLVMMWRKGMRFDAVVAASAFLAMLAIQGSWENSYAGGAGPRYVVPALPFLAAPLAVAWRRWRLATPVVAAISVVTMLAATFTKPQLPSDFEGGLGYWLTQGLAPTIYTIALGRAGWLVSVATIVGAAVLVRAASRRDIDLVGVGAS